MKKSILVVLVLVMFIFTGCEKYFPSLYKKRAAEVGETIISAIETQDSELLKRVLSEKALNAEDIDDSIDYLFKLIDEEIVSVEKSGWPEFNHYDRTQKKRSKALECWYDILTKSGKKYRFGFCYYVVQDFDETELGVNRIMLYLNDGMPVGYKPLTDYTRAGIVTPDWSDDD